MLSNTNAPKVVAAFAVRLPAHRELAVSRNMGGRVDEERQVRQKPEAELRRVSDTTTTAGTVSYSKTTTTMTRRVSHMAPTSLYS